MKSRQSSTVKWCLNSQILFLCRTSLMYIYMTGNVKISNDQVMAQSELSKFWDIIDSFG